MRMPWDKALVDETRLGDVAMRHGLPEVQRCPPMPAVQAPKEEPYISIASPKRTAAGTEVEINGVPFKYLRGVKVEIEVGKVNVAHFTLSAIRLEQLDLAGAELTIDSEAVPEAVQEALWKHLNFKYAVK